MNAEELKKSMIKSSTKIILDASRGLSVRKQLDPKVIDLASERAKRRGKSEKLQA